MFNFDRTKILPLFLTERITVAELARKAGISHKAAYRAINGLSITAPLELTQWLFLKSPRRLRRLIDDGARNMC